MQILISRGGGIGDVLMLTAVTRALRAQHPKATILFKTRHPQALQGNPDIDRLIKYDFEQAGKIDLSLNFNGSVEPRSILVDGKVSASDYMSIPRIDLLFRCAGLPVPEQPKLVYCVSQQETDAAERHFQYTDLPRVVFALNSSSPVRTYPIELSCRAIELLAERYHVTVTGDIGNLWGSGHPFVSHFRHWADKPRPTVLNLVDQTTFREAAAIVNAADLLVCGDTGILHLAGALQKPCVALFGNIDPRLRVSHYPTVTALVRKIACSFCGDVITDQCPSFAAIKRKHAIGADCMRAIQPGEIVEAVAGLLSDR